MTSFLLLIPFFIVLIIFAVFSKSDLYAHEHDKSINKEVETFSANYKVLKKLDIENNYNISNNHIYN